MVPFFFVVAVVVVVVVLIYRLIYLLCVCFFRIKLGIWNISFHESEFFLETVCSK